MEYTLIRSCITSEFIVLANRLFLKTHTEANLLCILVSEKLQRLIFPYFKASSMPLLIKD